MPHPIYGPPRHQLEVIRFTLRLPEGLPNPHVVLEVQGTTSTQRSALWSTSEVWGPTDPDRIAGPIDHIHHMAQLAYQDRPASQQAWQRALAGSYYAEQEPLM